MFPRARRLRMSVSGGGWSDRIPRRRAGATFARGGSGLLILLLASAMVLNFAPVARGQDIEWTRQFGSASSDDARGISVDASGIYVAGRVMGALPGQTYSGNNDAFVRKYDTSGTEVWTRQFGTSDSDFVSGISVDVSGVYVAGTVSGALPGQTHSGGTDAFVRKYDAAGTEVWTRQFGTPISDQANGGVSVSASGVYVSGFTYGTLPGQTPSGGADTFVRKYDTSGTELWTRQFGSSSEDNAEGGISVDASGVYMAGATNGALPGQTSSGAADAFVRKYDTSGTEAWTRQFGSSGDDLALGISVGPSGVHVSGWTSGALPDQTSSGTDDAFVRKYDTSGTEAWTRQFGTAPGDFANDVSSDASGVYVGGATNGALPGQVSLGDSDAFVRKYDAAGTEVWTRQFGTASGDEAMGVALDSSDVYVAGSTLGTLPGHTSSGGRDAFVVKFGPQVVTIDIKPGSYPNSVDCKSKGGNVPAGIFTDDDFNAALVDVSTLELEGTPVSEVHGRLHLEDLDDDGDLDAVVHLDKGDVCTATVDLPLDVSVPVVLTGATTDDQQFQGTDTIRIIKR